MEKSRRKMYLINPRFQLCFIGYFFSCFLVAIIIIIGSVNYFFWKFNQMGINANLPRDHIFFSFINDQQLQMNLLMGTVIIVVMIIILVGGILLSHKIAGPIHHFCQDLELMSKGSVREINFRKGDFFIEISHAFNRFIKRI